MTEAENHGYGPGWFMMKTVDIARSLFESGDTSGCLDLVDQAASKEARQAVERWEHSTLWEADHYLAVEALIGCAQLYAELKLWEKFRELANIAYVWMDDNNVSGRMSLYYEASIVRYWARRYAYLPQLEWESDQHYVEWCTGLKKISPEAVQRCLHLGRLVRRKKRWKLSKRSFLMLWWRRLKIFLYVYGKRQITGDRLTSDY